MSFRPLPPFIVYRDNEDVPLAGGTLEFLDPGTTDPKNVYAEQGLTTNLGNVITLNSAGRPSTAVWTSGNCRIRVYDVEGTLVDEEDPVVDTSFISGMTIPDLLGHTGWYLTNDGVDPEWADLSAYLLPDQMGQAGKFLTTNGGDASWATVENEITLPEGGVTVDTTTITIGDVVIKRGSGSVAASGANQATGTFSFGYTFDAPPTVVITPNTTNIASIGYNPVFAVTSVTTTGANISFDVNNDGTVPIINTINFGWIAIGVKP